MTFTEILPAPAERAFSISEDWAQGRATFGGLTAAAVLRVMGGMVEPERTCRSMLATFAGPVAPGKAEVEASIVRSGKSATFAEGRVTQGGNARCLVQASFGADRDSRVEVTAEPRPEANPPGDLPELPYLPGITPAFTQHFEYRWTTGGLPFSSSERANIGGWCRLRDDDASASAELITALVDAWPAPVLPLLESPAPASTVTWALDFVHIDPGARASGWWYFTSCAEAARAGYAHCRAMLWDPSGTLAAVSRQTVAVFA